MADPRQGITAQPTESKHVSSRLRGWAIGVAVIGLVHVVAAAIKILYARAHGRLA